MKPHSPLEQIRVVELGHIVAGPCAGLILADLGADVIKLEQPRVGDGARNMPNYGSTFYFLNRNKRSLALDLKSEAGKTAFGELVTSADVVVDNFGPDQLQRWGVDYKWARAINPRIIYCSIKGFLPGPYHTRPFLDELAQMASGLAYMTGPPGQPLRAGASVVDIGAATYAVLGILASLLQREASGEGCEVVSGLFETSVFWVGQHILRTQLTGRVPEPLPARAMGGQMGWGVYQIFDTADRRQIFIAVTGNRHWREFCNAMGFDDWVDDPELKTNARRVAARDRIIPRIQRRIAAMAYREIADLLAMVNLPYAPVNTPQDLLDDPHLASGDFWQSVEVDGSTLQGPSLPVKLVGSDRKVRRPPPRLGQHSREILHDLGFSQESVDRWERQGAVQQDGGMLSVDAQPEGDRGKRD